METSHAKDILPQNKPSEDALENTIVPASDTVVKPEPDTAQDAVIQTPPELSERYTFVRELGRGTQGHVYEAIRLVENGIEIHGRRFAPELRDYAECAFS